jgi:hypothetical protein
MDNELKENWKKIAAKTKYHPLLYSVAVSENCKHELTVQGQAVIRYLVSVLFITMGVLSFMALWNSSDPDVWYVLLAGLAVVFIISGVYHACRTKKIVVSHSGCRIYCGFVLSRKCLEVPATLLQFQLNMGKQQTGISHFRKGRVVFSVHLRSNGSNLQPIIISAANRRSAFDKVLFYLDRCSIAIKDDTIAEETSQAGVIRIVKTGLSRNGQQFKAMNSIHRPQTVIFKRSFYVAALWTLCFLFGLGGVIFMVVTGGMQRPLIAAPYFVGFLGIMGLGVIGLLVGFGTVKAVASGKDQTVIVKEGLLAGKFGTTLYESSNICGLQICRQFAAGDPESGDFEVFELNLILYSTPVTERVNLLNDQDRQRVIREAEGLSKMLGKPVFYHIC